MNEGSTVAVTELSSNDRFLVFDLTHRQHTHSIEAEDLKTSYPSLSEAAITEDGHFLVCTGDVELKDEVTEEEESETAMLVYDLEKRMCCCLFFLLFWISEDWKNGSKFVSGLILLRFLLTRNMIQKVLCSLFCCTCY